MLVDIFLMRLYPLTIIQRSLNNGDAMACDILILSARELGTCIREARKRAGLTQADAAGLCGVSVPFFNAIENGKGTAQIDKALHVCRQLGVRVYACLPGDAP